MIFVKVEDYSDLFIQIFHYETLNPSGSQNQERFRMNASMSVKNLLSNHTSKPCSHENSNFKSMSNNSALIHEYQKTSKSKNDTQVSKDLRSTFFRTVSGYL